LILYATRVPIHLEPLHERVIKGHYVGGDSSAVGLDVPNLEPLVFEPIKLRGMIPLERPCIEMAAETQTLWDFYWRVLLGLTLLATGLDDDQRVVLSNVRQLPNSVFLVARRALPTYRRVGKSFPLMTGEHAGHLHDH